MVVWERVKEEDTFKEEGKEGFVEGKAAGGIVVLRTEGKIKDDNVG